MAGAVALSRPIAGLKDSKKLSPGQRQWLAAIITTQAAAYGLGWVSPQEVDTIGLTAAVKLAMERAMAEIRLPYDQLIVDGNYNFLVDLPGSQAMIRADDSVPAVSAASIIAKVARDTYMQQQAMHYPGYGFERHVGYGTAAHRAALATYGICDLHRRSYKPIQALLQ